MNKKFKMLPVILLLFLTACAKTQEQAVTEMTTAEQVDFDLTAMGSDMVYATVYQMMTDPATYQEKRIRMQGTCVSSFYEPTQQVYHYVMIADAMACCQQGMEFVLKEDRTGEEIQYPENGSFVEVTGIYETYQEEGDPTLYCRLRDASLSILQEAETKEEESNANTELPETAGTSTEAN